MRLWVSFYLQPKRLFLLLNRIFPFIINGRDLLPLSSFLPLHLPRTILPLGTDSFIPDFPVSSSLFVLPEPSESIIYPALQCHRVHALNNVLFQHWTQGWTEISSYPFLKHRPLTVEALPICIYHNSSRFSVCTTALNGPHFTITLIHVFSFHSGLLLQLFL